MAQHEVDQQPEGQSAEHWRKPPPRPPLTIDRAMGRRIRRLRRAFKVTQTELAARSGTVQSFVSVIERGWPSRAKLRHRLLATLEQIAKERGL